MASQVENPHWHPAQALDYPPTPAATPLDVHTLAYIVHPSHEIASITSPEAESLDMRKIDRASAGVPPAVIEACFLLDMSVEAMHT